MADEDVILDDTDDDMEIVHWYEPEPMSLSLVQASGAVVTAFALGVLTAVGVLALTGRIRD
jgi:hypothetical protein